MASWWYTSDDRVAIYEGTHCLDESDGNKIQIWQCFPGNANQGAFLDQAVRTTVARVRC